MLGRLVVPQGEADRYRVLGPSCYCVSSSVVAPSVASFAGQSSGGLASGHGVWPADRSHWMTSLLVALCLDAVDPSRLARFWAN